MSTIKTKKVQVGTDSTASNNFTIYTPGTPDGTVRIGNGNADSPTEVGRFDANGYAANNIQIGTDATSSNNFTIYQPATPDGTLRIGVGNADSPTEVARVTNNGLFNKTGIGFNAKGTAGVTAQPTTGDEAILSSLFTDVSTDGGFNYGSHYNTANGTFTAPENGIYFVFGNVRWDTANFVQNSFIRTVIKINSVTRQTGIAAINGNNEAYTSYFSQNISGIMLLNKYDILRLAGGLNAGTAVLYANESSWGAYFLG